MSDVTSLVISIVSLVGTVSAALIGGYITYYNEERKAQREIGKILLKYRDPLLLSAQDLQARLYGLCDLPVMDFMDKDVPGDDTYRDTLFIYTAYVVGQYLSWVWILRRQAQFVALISSAAPKWSIFRTQTSSGASQLVKDLDQIKAAFNSDSHGDLEHPFILFKAHQVAIGEIMTSHDEKSGEYYCMGFATFTQKWKNGDPAKQHKEDYKHHSTTATASDNMAGVQSIPDAAFRAQFASIEKGIQTIWEYRQRSLGDTPGKPSNLGSDGRLRRLQHLLLDLMKELDPNGLLNNEHESLFAGGPPHCACSRPACHCKCTLCKRNPKHLIPGVSVDCSCATCRPALARQYSSSNHPSKDAEAGAQEVANSHAANAAHA